MINPSKCIAISRLINYFVCYPHLPLQVCRENIVLKSMRSTRHQWWTKVPATWLCLGTRQAGSAQDFNQGHAKLRQWLSIADTPFSNPTTDFLGWNPSFAHISTSSTANTGSLSRRTMSQQRMCICISLQQWSDHETRRSSPKLPRALVGQLGPGWGSSESTIC